MRFGRSQLAVEGSTRELALLLSVLLLVPCVTHADPIPKPHVIKAYEIVPPTADDMEQAYPDAPARLGIGGRVVLDCVIRSDNGVDCRVLSETPTGQGFGDAALAVAPKVRIKPLVVWSLAGQHIALPIRFASPRD